MSMELKFNHAEIDLPIYGKIMYEWALQTIDDTNRLVFHFFLKKGEEDVEFGAALAEAGSRFVANVTTTEVFYSEPPFDGHDLIITGVQPFAAAAIHSVVIGSLWKALDDLLKKK